MNREKYKKLLLSLLCVIIIVASVGFIDANSKNAPLEETDARSLQAAEQAELKPGDLTAQQLETATLAEADRHELTKQYDANRNGHVHRLYQQEQDMNTIIYQNRDGTKTAYFYNTDVKYIDENGAVQDKSNKISAVTAQSAKSPQEYAYAVEENDIKTYFPKATSVSSGVLLTKGDYSIRMVPVSMRNTAMQMQGLNTGLIQAEKVTEFLTNTDYMKYENVFGSGTSLKFTPDYEGIKSETIISSNTGNQFVFELYTQNLMPSTDGTTIKLIDKTQNQPVLELAPIYVYDSYGTDTTNNHYTIQTISSGRYRITLVVDEDFLNRSDIVYPVSVQSAVYQISNTTIQSKGIYKKGSTTYTSYFGSGYMDAGNVACNKIGRAFLTFPGLMNNQTYQSLNAAQIYLAHVHVYANPTSASTHIDACMYTGDSWTNIDFDEVEGLYHMPGANITAGNMFYGFDITEAFRLWKSGIYDPDMGIVLVNSDEKNTRNSVKFRTSSATSSFRPYLTFNYTEEKSLALNVQHDDQTYINSCGSASCRLALTYEGVSILSDDRILRAIAQKKAQREHQDEYETDASTIASTNYSTDTEFIVPGVNLVLEQSLYSGLQYAWNWYSNSTYTETVPEVHNGKGFYLTDMEYVNFLLTSLANDHPLVIVLRINDTKYFQYEQGHYVVIKSVTYNNVTQQYDVTVVDPQIINNSYPETVTLPVSELRRYSGAHSGGRLIHYKYWK